MDHIKKGVEVSEYQGHIDWEKAKVDEIEFTLLKSTCKSGRHDKQLV